MILPDLVIPELANQFCLHSGIDSLEQCLDKKHFKSYAYDLHYHFNSRGFRDAEWPDTPIELKNSIWCVGDSFTVGIGSPRSHTWSYLLQEVTKKTTVNVSMNGASNNWIARRTCEILKNIQPDLVVIHWSYDHRRELSEGDVKNHINTEWKDFYTNCRDPKNWPACPNFDQFDTLPQHIQTELQELHNLTKHSKNWRLDDEQRRIWHIDSTDDENNANMLECIRQVESCRNNTKIVHSVIPKFTNPKNADTLWKLLNTYDFIPEFNIQDLARDGKHYDIKTSQFFVQQIIEFLKTRHSIELFQF
jgi:hypothetical protein